MIECGLCFAEYQEGELELHREMCVVLLMFRCTLCNVDFVSKEGLWNHLDLHEIADESKELHYQEIKAKHKLHQCVLCNDQRAYSESLYWNHVHEVHDGFFLRCSDCGEHFRSEQHKSNHELSQCKVKDQTVASDFADLEVDQVPVKVDNTTSGCDKGVLKNKKQDSSLNSSARSEMKQPPTEDLINKEKIRSSTRRSAKLNVVNDTDNSMIEKNIAGKRSPKSSATKCLRCDTQYATASLLRRHNKACHEPTECSICGITSYGVAKARYHKTRIHLEPRYECAKCLKKFYKKFYYNKHLDICGLLSPEMKHPKESKGGRSLLGHEPSSVKELDGSECISGLSLKDTSDPEMRIESPSSEEASCTECSHCGIKESNAVSLVCHILTHHEPVGCDICGITSPSLLQAQNHKKMVHNKSKNKCPHCLMQSAGGKPFQKHILRCKNLKFPCMFCGIMSATMSSVTEHETGYCRAKTVLNDGINVSKEQGQKSVETGLSTENSLIFNEKHDGSASSTMREKTVLSQSGLAKSKCYYCNADFSYPGYLIHHLKSFHELTKCDICGMTLLGIAAPKKHRVLCHTEPRFVCPNCGRNFYQKVKYTSHWSSCKRKKYACEICGHRYKTIDAVEWHKREEHSDRIILGEIKISSQADPGQSTENPPTKADGAALQENAKDDEGFCSNRPSSTQENNSNYYEEIQSLEDARPSGHSLASVNDDDDTDSHMDEKESRMRSVATLKDSCKIQVGSGKISQPRVENSSVQQYRCSICEITSTEFSYIRQHMLTSHTDRMFQCHICSKKFRIRSEMESHEAVCVDRKFSCDFCSKKFKYLRNAEIHKKRYHRGSEPLGNVTVEGTACTEQQKSIYQIEKSSEENVAQQHEGENPSSGSSNAKCPYCAKSFSNNRLLSHHIDQSHEPSACDICGLTFATGLKAMHHKLKTHLKQTKFECPYCPLKYVAAERYEQHLSICKSKKYTCDVCSKKFAALRLVVKHKQMYHQDKDSKKQNQNQTEKNSHEKEVSLLHDSSGSQVHGMKEVQTSSMNMSHGENIELISEIKIEDTMLQEQDHQVPNEDQEKSSTSTAARADQRKICKHPHGSKSKVIQPEDAVLANGISIKEEFQEEEGEENLIGAQSTTESSECHGIPSDQHDESVVCHEAGDQVGPCFMIKTHTEFPFKNPECEKPFDKSHALQNRIDVQAKATKNKLRIKEHTSDGSETRKSKRIRIKEEN